jgi:hypothetical protein
VVSRELLKRLAATRSGALRCAWRLTGSWRASNVRSKRDEALAGKAALTKRYQFIAMHHTRKVVHCGALWCVNLVGGVKNGGAAGEWCISRREWCIIVFLLLID